MMNTTMTKATIVFAALCIALAPAAARAARTPGNPVEVAPNVENTHVQMWPRAAWCEGSTSWLVAWREGATNDFAADIWCARISADGKALDAAGIKVCGADDNQEQPWVASDGKGFLVAWEDFRNGKDYDVYAARVDAEGKVLDADGFLVAGGEHNQCHPAVTFAGGNYYVAWQAYAPTDNGGRYLLHGARVSADGKVLDAGGVPLTPPGGGNAAIDEYANACNPVIAATADRILIGHLINARTAKGKGKHGGIVTVDPATGKVKEPCRALGPASRGGHVGFVTNATNRMPAMAFSDKGGLFAAPSAKGGGVGDCMVVWRLDETGKETGPPQRVAGAYGGRMSPLVSIASDGEGYLLTLDRPLMPRGSRRKILQIYGLSISAEGKPLPEGEITDEVLKGISFVMGDGGNDQMQGYACSGPDGTCLVVSVEGRGSGALVVLARLVK